MTKKVKELKKMLKVEGWYHFKTTGSHFHYKHPHKPGKVTVPGNDSDEIAPKTLKSIYRQAGW